MIPAIRNPQLFNRRLFELISLSLNNTKARSPRIFQFSKSDSFRDVFILSNLEARPAIGHASDVDFL